MLGAGRAAKYSLYKDTLGLWFQASLYSSQDLSILLGWVALFMMNVSYLFDSWNFFWKNGPKYGRQKKGRSKKRSFSWPSRDRFWTAQRPAKCGPLPTLLSTKTKIRTPDILIFPWFFPTAYDSDKSIGILIKTLYEIFVIIFHNSIL